MGDLFTPPDPPDFSGAINILQRRQQADQQRQQEDEDRSELLRIRQSREAANVAIEGIKSGMPAKELTSSLRDQLMGSDMDLVNAFAKGYADKQKKDSSQAELMAALSQGQSATVDRAAAGMPAPAPGGLGSIEQRSSALNRALAGGVPENVVRAESRNFSGAVESKQIAQQSQDLRARADEGRRESTDIRKERRDEARLTQRDQVDSMARTIAAQQSGVAPNGSGMAAYDDLENEVGTTKALDIWSKALVKSRGYNAQLRERLISANGKRSDVQLTEDLTTFITEDWGEETLAAQDPTGAKMRLMGQGLAWVDPYFASKGELRFGHATRPEEAIKRQETRRAQVMLMDTVERLEDSFVDLKAAMDRGEVPFAGPGLPSGVSDGANFFGLGSPEVERYRAAQFLFVSGLLKATQGSRPSDFDLQMYLALAPGLQEIQSGTAAAKIKLLRETVDSSIRSEGIGVDRIRHLKPNGLGADALRKFRTMSEKLNNGETVTNAEMAAAMDANDKWVASGDAKRFQLKSPDEDFTVHENDRLDAIARQAAGVTNE